MGNKGKVAFVIGWFNCVKSFSQLIQLGQRSGAYPLVNESKLCYFPFLKRNKIPTRTMDLKYNYDAFAYKELTINPISNRNGIYNCMFLGSYAVNHTDSTPLFYEMYPGTQPEFLGKQNVCDVYSKYCKKLHFSRFKRNQQERKR